MLLPTSGVRMLFVRNNIPAIQDGLLYPFMFSVNKRDEKREYH